MNTSPPPPILTAESYQELWEALGELDRAFSGRARAPVPTAESVNARLWLEAYWRWQLAQAQPQAECRQ